MGLPDNDPLCHSSDDGQLNALALSSLDNPVARKAGQAVRTAHPSFVTVQITPTGPFTLLHLSWLGRPVRASPLAVGLFVEEKTVTLSP
jgi:hypothetical protein